MRAFTHLCEKVNISLFNDTITLYPKKTGGKSMQLASFFGLPVFVELDCYYAEVTNFVEEQFQMIEYTHGATQLGVRRFIHREDADHDQYHQDAFDRDETHMHAQFRAPIDEAKFRQVLTVFVDRNIISAEEKARCLEAYHQANVMADPAKQKFMDQLLILHTKASELEHKAEKDHATYGLAARSARALHTALSDALEVYRRNENAVTYQAFKRTCDDAIRTARPELEKHRDYNYILANIGLAVLGLGVGYLAAGLINLAVNGRFLFFSETNSISKVNELEKRLDAIPIPAI
ncbi:hypothetical protein [Legionella oakridgensis]|nr:hypothetical protein [Legionella oakridgensis]ETO92219.1 hypothetical protein LOR_89c24890 [Legionella oakridgensis RV-2-2007]KTD39024.1 effector protein B, substrate of the Dot/Icm secretion system [Legionella oakridgensis]STY21248.1 LepB protein [Legionella longbeachae]